MNAHIPSRLPFGYAKMTATSAMLPFEIQALLPFSTKLFPFSSNVVRRDAGSLPAVGSVSPKHMTFSPRVAGGRYRCFCSSLAHFWTVTCPRETWPERNVRTPVPSWPILSRARHRLVRLLLDLRRIALRLAILEV